MTTLLRETRFEKTTGGSNKYYEITLHYDEAYGQYVVTRYWGRIGTLGQKVGDKFVLKSTAEEFMSEKVARRMARGYKVVLNETHAVAAVAEAASTASVDLSSDKRLVASSFDFSSDLTLMRSVDRVAV